MKNRAAAYTLLVLLALVAFSYQARFSIEAVRDRLEGAGRAENPFSLEPPARLTPAGPPIRSLREAARAAGLRRGDILLAIDGVPFCGMSSLAVPVDARRPGDTLRVGVRRGSENLDFSIRLGADTGGRIQGAAGAAFTIWMSVVIPWFCLLLGFWIPLARPADRRAWLVLALMLSFSHLTRDPNLLAWENWLRPPAVVFHSFWNSTWTLWLFLFGLYFPEPFEWERRHRGLKWVLIALFTALAAVNAVGAIGSSENYRLAHNLDHWFFDHRQPMAWLGALPTALFLAAAAARWHTERRPDFRRRLRLLLAGSLAGIGPLFAIAVHGMLRGRMFGPHVPGWVLFPSLAMLFLFPAALAYVIVVERAMDIRVVLRQSVRYTLARRGLWVLRGALAGLIIWAAVAASGRERMGAAQTIALGALAAAAVIVTRRATDRMAAAVDRRFFREAYDAEQILSDLSEQVRTIVEEKTVLETVARRVSDSLHVPKLAILVASNGHFETAHAVGLNGTGVRFGAGSPVVEHLKQSRRPARVYFDDSHSWIYHASGMDEPERERLRALGAQLLVPLAVKERLIGFLSLGEKLSEEPYSHGDVRLIESVAAQTALALENSYLTAEVAAEAARRERLNREIEIAREVQERLFPQNPPAVAGLDYTGLCIPAQGVGGDYYDFLTLQEGDLGIAVGDVSGKGVPAALLMAGLQASLRSQAIVGPVDLSVLMTNLNRLIYDATPDNRFATFFYAQYETRTRRLVSVNAGHNAPLLFRADGGVERLEAGGLALGFLPRADYGQETKTLEPGDVLIAFTDGVTEAQNPELEEFGEEGLTRAVEAARGLAAEEVARRIVEAVNEFARGAAQSDDLTLVVLRAIAR